MSTMLKEKHALAKLRAELEGRKGKLCWCCKKFGYLVCNCRNKKEEGEGVAMPQNKFEILSSRVMQCGIEERTIRSIRVVVKCFKCGEEGHKCRECPLWERKEKRVVCLKEGKAHQGERRPAYPIRKKVQERGKRLRRMEEEKVARPVKGEAQQEWRRSSMKELRKRAEEHCGKGVPEETQLLEIGWMTGEIVVLYLICKCGEKRSHVEDNQGQGVIPFWKWKELSWCGCKGKTKGKAARPREAKAQQSGARSEKLESAAGEGGSRKEARRTFKMLREVWLNIGVEKIDMHEGVMIKALLDSGATGMFMDRQTAARHGFKLQKLERPIAIRNVDGTNNGRGAITYQV